MYLLFNNDTVKERCQLMPVVNRKMAYADSTANAITSDTASNAINNKQNNLLLQQ